MQKGRDRRRLGRRGLRRWQVRRGSAAGGGGAAATTLGGAQADARDQAATLSEAVQGAFACGSDAKENVLLLGTGFDGLVSCQSIDCQRSAFSLWETLIIPPPLSYVPFLPETSRLRSRGSRSRVSPSPCRPVWYECKLVPRPNGDGSRLAAAGPVISVLGRPPD